MLQRSKSLTAASSIDRPSSERLTTTASSAPFVRSNSPIVELSLAIVSARSIPGMSGHPRAVAGARVGDAGERLSADGSDQQGEQRSERDQAAGTNRHETVRERSHVADILMQQPA